MNTSEHSPLQGNQLKNALGHHLSVTDCTCLLIPQTPTDAWRGRQDQQGMRQGPQGTQGLEGSKALNYISLTDPQLEGV